MFKLSDDSVLIIPEFMCPSGRVTSKKGAQLTATAGRVVDASRLSCGVEVWNTPALKAARAEKDAVKSWLDDETAEWGGKTRLVKNNKLDKIHAKFDEGRGKMAPHVRQVKAEMAAKRDADRFELGDLFDESAYPTDEQLDRKFKIDFTILNIPEVGDARAGWDTATEQRFVENVKRQHDNNVKAVLIEIATKLHKEVAHVFDRMNTCDGTRKGRFTDTLIDKLAAKADMMEAYNITNSQEIKDIVKDIREQLCNHTPKELRDEPELREEKGAKARQLVSRLAKFTDEQVNA